jgi:hypothetical protein
MPTKTAAQKRRMQKAAERREAEAAAAAAAEAARLEQEKKAKAAAVAQAVKTSSLTEQEKSDHAAVMKQLSLDGPMTVENMRPTLLRQMNINVPQLKVILLEQLQYALEDAAAEDSDIMEEVQADAVTALKKLQAFLETKIPDGVPIPKAIEEAEAAKMEDKRAKQAAEQGAATSADESSGAPATPPEAGDDAAPGADGDDEQDQGLTAEEMKEAAAGVPPEIVEAFVKDLEAAWIMVANVLAERCRLIVEPMVEEHISRFSEACKKAFATGPDAMVEEDIVVGMELLFVRLSKYQKELFWRGIKRIVHPLLTYSLLTSMSPKAMQQFMSIMERVEPKAVGKDENGGTTMNMEAALPDIMDMLQDMDFEEAKQMMQLIDQNGGLESIVSMMNDAAKADGVKVQGQDGLFKQLMNPAAMQQSMEALGNMGEAERAEMQKMMTQKLGPKQASMVNGMMQSMLSGNMSGGGMAAMMQQLPQLRSMDQKTAKQMLKTFEDPEKSKVFSAMFADPGTEPATGGGGGGGAGVPAIPPALDTPEVRNLMSMLGKPSGETGQPGAPAGKKPYELPKTMLQDMLKEIEKK